MSDSAAFERQARALEGIERNSHEIMKVLADISGVLVEMRDEFKDVSELISTFSVIASYIKQQMEEELEQGKEIYPREPTDGKE